MYIYFISGVEQTRVPTYTYNFSQFPFPRVLPVDSHAEFSLQQRYLVTVVRVVFKENFKFRDKNFKFSINLQSPEISRLRQNLLPLYKNLIVIDKAVSRNYGRIVYIICYIINNCITYCDAISHYIYNNTIVQICCK